MRSEDLPERVVYERRVRHRPGEKEACPSGIIWLPEDLIDDCWKIMKLSDTVCFGFGMTFANPGAITLFRGMSRSSEVMRCTHTYGTAIRDMANYISKYGKRALFELWEGTDITAIYFIANADAPKWAEVNPHVIEFWNAYEVMMQQVDREEDTTTFNL